MKMWDHLLKIVFLMICFKAVAAPSYASNFQGPMETKNQFPLLIHLNAPAFASASLENSFSADLAYSSDSLIKFSSEWEAELDMELAELNIKVRKTFYDSLELGIDLPFVSFSGGFMDPMVNDFHGTFGFSDYGRKSRPDNAFLYEVKRNGVTIVRGEPGEIGISDIRLSAKKAVISSDPAVSLKLSVELPTGDAKKGFGSGNFGTDITLLLDKKFGESIMTYYNLGIAFPGDLDGYQTVKMRSFIFGCVALEMAAWKNVNLLTQLSLQESPYPKTGIKNIDATATLLTFGGRYITKSGGSYEFTFTEDPNIAGTPDFTYGLSYKSRF